MQRIKWLTVFLLFLNINCYRGLVKKQENIFQIEGSVSYKDEVLSGAVVGVYLENKVQDSGVSEEPFVKLVTDENGKFIVNLPAGNYYFKAWKIKDATGKYLQENDLFCFYGGNPVNISGSKEDLILKCVKIHSIQRQIDESLDRAELTGKIIDINGRPMERAYVYLFSVSNPDLRRMADIVSAPTLNDGSFSVTFDSAGYYFLMVRKRRNTEERGPLKTGDYYGYYYANPLEIKDKTKNYLQIECIEKKKDQLPVNLISIPVGKSAIRGRIIDKNGNPVSGMFAFTYKDEFNTGKKPDYKSIITGEDGGYTILIEEPGFYVLGARKTYGGPPEPGDIFGFYNGTENNKIEVKKREVRDNIDIIVEEVK
ncbi:MAG: prealbumin-like fold domain-containing protein [bacterium]|nr:prealbumin-like fold domain-containing protein [bacterium]